MQSQVGYHLVYRSSRWQHLATQLRTTIPWWGDRGGVMPEATEGPTVLRILLGTQLRRLRESRGISAQAAAKAIRGSESKISRIELGRNAIREIHVLDLLTFYGGGRPAAGRPCAISSATCRA